MNFRATAVVKPFDLVKIQRLIVPKIVAAVTESCGIVVDAAKENAPSVTGELQESIHTESVSLVGTAVTGEVVASAPHAGFVEFGTGIRGDGTYPGPLPESGVPITGEWIYDYKQQNWEGHEAQPYMRPAIDESHSAILDTYRKRGFKVTG